MSFVCSICKEKILELAEKIICESCNSMFHLTCANVEEDFLQALVENSIKWACGQCVKRKRLTRTESEMPFEGTHLEQLTDLKLLLEKFRNDVTKELSKISEGQKQLEMDLGKSMETCHQKLDENLMHLRELAKCLERQQASIEELRFDSIEIKDKIKELSLSKEPSHGESADTEVRNGQK